MSPEDEIEIKSVLTAIEKEERRIYDTERRAGFDAMLRQITESVVISKIREHDLMNSKSEWNYGRILRTVVNQ